MPKQNNPLASNPHFQIGQQRGQVIIRFIDTSFYKTLEVALEAKVNFGAMLKSELGYDENNPKYLENLGMIHVLEEAVKNQE